MELQNYMPTGLQKITEKLTKFLLVMEFYLIMKVQEEEKHLSQRKLFLRFVRLKRENKKNYFWET